MTTKNRGLIAGHFDGHEDAAVQFRVHCQIEHIPSFARSHWMPPSAAAMVDKFVGK